MTAGDRICGRCGHHFCNSCVVFPFGASKPPMCITCALEQGGVRRQSTARPKLSRRSIRERLAVQRQELEATAASTAIDDATAAEPDEDPWFSEDLDTNRIPGAWRQEF